MKTGKRTERKQVTEREMERKAFNLDLMIYKNAVRDDTKDEIENTKERHKEGKNNKRKKKRKWRRIDSESKWRGIESGKKTKKRISNDSGNKKVYSRK